MEYTILDDTQDIDLVTRLLNIRNISDEHQHFLQPTYSQYRHDPALLSDIDIAIIRIVQAMEQQEKIMIFGDYDVDGIMSSYVMYTFFTKFLKYKNISIRLPHRTRDGYGIKTHHIDDIISCNCSLIITVDNGITSVQEASYAKEKWIDMIITDHHSALDILPDAYAVVNPQTSPDYPFKEICGATVAFKLCMHLADHLWLERTEKKQIHDRLLPFVSIATIADCMPLINENRLLVKKWFELINQRRSHIAPALRQFLEYLNIKEIDTYHVGFMIWPRLNATGRMDDAMQGLESLLTSHPEKQRHQLGKIEELNNERRKVQQQMVTEANGLINIDKLLLVAASENFHEGIVGIVAGRLTEKHYKPSLILRIDTYKKTATWSLRAPEYFNVVEMLKTADDLLLRYGGHAQAWGMTVDLDNLEETLARFDDYCSNFTAQQASWPTTSIDTILWAHELTYDLLDKVLQLAPYGMGNPEPLFAIHDVIISHAETVGRWEKTHLKLHCNKEDAHFNVMQRWKGDTIHEIVTDTPLTIIGKVKKDTFNGGFYVEGKWIGE